jgi:ADP-ribose pyrophosphatase YjhB (NUDIX family)
MKKDKLTKKEKRLFGEILVFAKKNNVEIIYESNEKFKSKTTLDVLKSFPKLILKTGKKRNKMKQVGSVLVMLHNDAGEPTGIVMGLRKDAKKWTLPGGHLNEGEDPKTGALRELKEEADFSPSPVHVKFLGSKEVDCADNQKRCIHAFQTMIHESKIDELSPENDPDKEVHEWKHIPLKNNCIPYDVFDNLYSKPNVCLLYAGIGPDKKKSQFLTKKTLEVRALLSS